MSSLLFCYVLFTPLCIFLPSSPHLQCFHFPDTFPFPLLSPAFLYSSPSPHLCPVGSCCVISHLTCRNVSLVWKLAACEDVDSLSPLRLTGRQKKGGKLTSQPLVFNFFCLTMFFFFSSFLYRTSTRLGEDRWPGVRGLLCWVSEEHALVLSCLLSLQETVSKFRGIIVIYSSVTPIGGQVLSLLF